MFDLPPDPPKLWLPPKPAIIRPASDILTPAPLAFLPGLAPCVGRSPPATIAFLSPLRGNSSNLTTYNFTAHNLGTPGDRFIGLAIGGSGSGAPLGSSVTVDGFSLSKAVTSVSGGFRSEIWMGAVGGSNTTGTISIAWASGMFDCCCAAFECHGLLIATPTATDTETVDNTAMTAAVSEGGIGIGCVITSGSVTWNWTGDGADQGDVGDGAGNLSLSAAMAAYASGGTATMTPDTVSGSPTVVACLATFR